MQTSDKRKIKKVPVLSKDEILELESIMYSNKDDDLSKKRFWKKVYNDRGLEEGGIVDAE